MTRLSFATTLFGSSLLLLNNFAHGVAIPHGSDLATTIELKTGIQPQTTIHVPFSNSENDNGLVRREFEFDLDEFKDWIKETITRLPDAQINADYIDASNLHEYVESIREEAKQQQQSQDQPKLQRRFYERGYYEALFKETLEHDPDIQLTPETKKNKAFDNWFENLRQQVKEELASNKVDLREEDQKEQDSSSPSSSPSLSKEEQDHCGIIKTSDPSNLIRRNSKTPNDEIEEMVRQALLQDPDLQLDLSSVPADFADFVEGIRQEIQQDKKLELRDEKK